MQKALPSPNAGRFRGKTVPNVVPAQHQPQHQPRPRPRPPAAFDAVSRKSVGWEGAQDITASEPA